MATIVQARKSTNFDEVQQIYYQTWLASYRGLLAQSFLDQLTPPSWHPEADMQHLLLAQAGGKTVGLAKWGAARAANPPARGELRALYVLPAFQGRGIGSLLMEAARAKLAPFGSAYLNVLAANSRARGFYESCGWHQVGPVFSVAAPQGRLVLVRYVCHQF